MSGTGFTIAGGLPQYGWWRADPRWDIAANRNEPNRFGWIVEVDVEQLPHPADAVAHRVRVQVQLAARLRDEVGELKKELRQMRREQ